MIGVHDGCDTVYFDDAFDLGQYVTTVTVTHATITDCHGLDTTAKCVRLIRSRFPGAGIVLVVGDDVTVGKLESFGLGGEAWETHATRTPAVLPFPADHDVA